MRIRKLMLQALCATAFTTAVSVGCTGLEPYTIDAPDDLADKIAEFKAEKEAGKSDDYEEIDITVAIVGAEDNSSAWWAEFSQYFTVPSGKKLYVEFENFGSGVNNWNNWNVCVANPYERGADAYSEYFVLRSDWYGWGNADYNSSVIEFDYGGGEVNWDEFREKMQGATVTLSLDHARAGAAYLEVHSVATDGFEIVEKYNQKVSSTEDIEAFLIADGSHFNIKKAWLVPSEIAEIPDYPAVSIAVTGYPVTIPLGEEDYWGEAVATVTFEDGFTAVVDKEDLTIVAPDLTTTGTKTVVYSYNYTKLGNLGKAVAGYYNLEVTDLAAITVTRQPVTTTYYVYDQAVPFYTEGLEVTGTKGDGSTVVVDNSALTFGQVEPVEGEQEILIDFSGVTTTCKVMVKKGIEAVGALDFSNGWWTTFLSADKPVPSGESATVHMFLYSDNLENWHSPCTILRGAALNEYAVVRMDNFGWGDGYGTSVAESDWNFDVFAARQNMSAVSITVTNNGNNTADIIYNVTYANGESHIQKYSGLTVDSADLQMGIVTEESYLVILENAAVEARLTSIGVTKAPAVTTYYYFDNTALDFRTGGMVVSAYYSDGTVLEVPYSELDFSPVTVAEGPQEITITYKDDPSITTTVGINLVKGAYAVGAADLSGGFWSAFTAADKVIPSGSSVSFEMDVYSSCQANWNAPVTVLRKADLSLGADGEYAVVRIDNFGWGSNYATATPSSDWNWDLFLPMLTNAHVRITATNHGNNTATIRYDVTWANGEVHFQQYEGIVIDSSDAQVGVTIDGCYLVIVE